MSRTISRKRRDKMLQEQSRKCACCKAYIPSTTDARLDSTQSRMLCAPCMILIAQIRKSLGRGVTFGTVTDYFELGNGKVAQIEGDTTLHEQRVAGREAVARGEVPGMTLERYDAMTGGGPSEEESELEAEECNE